MYSDNPEKVLQQTRLTQTQAQSRQIQNVFYHLKLQILNKSDIFSGTLTVTFDNTTPTFIDFAGKTIQSVNLNNFIWHQNDILTNWREHKLYLQTLQEYNVLTIEFTSNFTNTGFGLFKYTKNDETYIYSLFCPNHAHTAFPCFDQPDIKATFQLELQCPADWNAISNTNQMQEILLDNNQKIFFFSKTKPISTYLFSLNVGNWIQIKNESFQTYRDIQMDLYCESFRQSQCRKLHSEIIEALNFGIQYYELLFDIQFPFEKYDQIFCSQFQNSAMEHPGAVLLTSTYLFNQLNPTSRTEMMISILHELSHMWFGNLVTMQWWDDLWLNEAFAVYISYQCLQQYTIQQQQLYDHIETKFMSYTQQGMLHDILSHAHPIWIEISEASEIQEYFDYITYHKGAAVLAELVNQIGMQQFTIAIQLYLRKYQWKTANKNQLFECIGEIVTKFDAKRWMNEWIETPSLNIISINQNQMIQEPFDNKYNVIRQQNIHLLVLYNSGEEILEISFGGKNAEIPYKNYDAIIMNYQNQSYCICQLEEKSLEFVIKHLADLQIHRQIQIVNILFQMCYMIGSYKISDYIQLVCNLLKQNNQNTQFINYIITTLQIIHKNLDTNYKIILGCEIFQQLENTLIQLISKQPISNQCLDIARIIVDNIGQFTSTQDHIQFLFDFINENIPQYSSIKYSMQMVKYFLDAYFYMAHLIDEENLKKYKQYWDKFIPNNQHLLYIQQGAQVVNHFDFFQDLIQNYTTYPMQMIENQLIGINNPYSPFTEQYECCYLNYLPKILETKNRQLIRTVIKQGFPKVGNLQRQLQYLTSLIEKCDNSLLKVVIEQIAEVKLKLKIQSQFQPPKNCI